MKDQYMIKIEQGSFLMGNSEKEKEGWKIELPVRRIYLTYDFEIGKIPVLFEEYESYCKKESCVIPDDYCFRIGYSFGRGTKPVFNVSWNEAADYCNRLSRDTGIQEAYDVEGFLLDFKGKRTYDISKVIGYRLPTEAEWEYAALGGHKSGKRHRYSGSDNLNEVGWYWKNSGVKKLNGSEKKWNVLKIVENMAVPHEAGKKKPNEAGLYDMSGNLWEWCNDWFGTYSEKETINPSGPPNGAHRCIRGGSFFFGAQTCRIAARNYFTPGISDFQTGFRFARTL